MSRRVLLPLAAIALLGGVCLAVINMLPARQDGDTVAEQRRAPVSAQAVETSAAVERPPDPGEADTAEDDGEPEPVAERSEVDALAGPREVYRAEDDGEPEPMAEPREVGAAADAGEAEASEDSWQVIAVEPMEGPWQIPAVEAAAEHPQVAAVKAAEEPPQVGAPQAAEEFPQVNAAAEAGEAEAPAEPRKMKAATQPGQSEEFEHVVVTVQLPALDEPTVWSGQGHGPNCAQTQVSAVLGIVIGRPHGITVARVIPDGPAAKGGIAPGDGIVKCGEATVTCPSRLVPYLKREREPRSVELTIRRPVRRGEASGSADAGGPGSP